MADVEDLNELWNELIDVVHELREDVKDTRKARRHLKNLDSSINEIGMALRQMSGKKGWLK